MKKVSVFKFLRFQKSVLKLLDRTAYGYIVLHHMNSCWDILIRCELFYTLKKLSLPVLLRINRSVVSTY